MPYPDYGPIGHALLLFRLLQALLLLTLIGLTSHLMSTSIINRQSTHPTIAILSVACFSLLYICGSTILYFQSLLPMLIACALDFGFTLCLLTLSIVIGRPLSDVNCRLVGKWAASGFGGTAQPFTPAIVTVPKNGSPTNLTDVGYGKRSHEQSDSHSFQFWLAGGSEHACVATKGVWGVTIAVTVFFCASAVSLGGLWWSIKKKNSMEKLKEVKGVA